MSFFGLDLATCSFLVSASPEEFYKINKILISKCIFNYWDAVGGTQKTSHFFSRHSFILSTSLIIPSCDEQHSSHLLMSPLRFPLAP
jgi:hypothetical protein